ncbi:hypothetical protein [Chelativorans salis]|uniref:Uncharacterized protein n=1 Tax=Chelativorans salis TaxID=2978478 RepID=A0ABT2LVB8_9HYPH|nr:hypothetical protein [Chelativorans sp. EGI FJ00035]MCT7378044.1 hypothetical protein [Chelativorans sp. EGI FJ00035]
MAGAADQVQFPETFANLCSPCRGGVCHLRIRHGDIPFRTGHQQVSFLDTRASFSLDKALGAAEPSGRRTCLTPKVKAQPDPERAAGSARALLGIKENTMGSIKRLQIVVFATDQIRRHRQQLEIVGS